jgi:NitT/TauT family transport system ATP-binding protein
MTASSALTTPAAAAPAQRDFVSVKNLSKIFGSGPEVLRDVSLHAAPGEFVSLIGPSGCGKSTILRLLAGLAEPSSGTLVIDGIAPKAARQITSFVFQDATLLPWRTAERNVSLTLELEGVEKAKRQQRTAELLELVGLKDFAHLYPRQLSGGMKMRVSIARALASAPRLLLMDEPFGALDEITRNRLNEELLRLRQQQKWTAFFVTHSVTEAVFLSNRILVMSARPGQINREITIDFPYPRTDELRQDIRFLQTIAEVTAALREVYL